MCRKKSKRPVHLPLLGSTLLLGLLWGCTHPETRAHEQMVNLLEELAQKTDNHENPYANAARAAWYEQQAATAKSREETWTILFEKGCEQLNAGTSTAAINTFESLKEEMLTALDTQAYAETFYTLDRYLALAYLRLGEQANCINHHGMQSCILPIRGDGLHQLTNGSENAAALYTDLLRRRPDDVEARWLLNLAHMTLDSYPQGVPDPYRIDTALFSLQNDSLPIFTDMGHHAGVGVNRLSGGSILEDFNQDGHLDIMASSWGSRDQLRLFYGQSDGGFTEATEAANLLGITGGLNIMQTDFNNDGLADVWILRGAWREKSGHLPNSLLRNNGNGTFTDVTVATGLLDLNPTQASVWADFNNDGLLDVFVAYETYEKLTPLRASLYLNHTDGLFRDVAEKADADVLGFLKGATATDFNQDGFMDLFVTNLEGEDFLLRNLGPNAEGIPQFENVTQQAGLGGERASFPCWFFDYDQDGWEDLLVFSLKFRKRNAFEDAVTDFLGQPTPTDKMKLFRNLGNGTFEDVSKAVQLDKVVLAMGCNFGDIDNDGWLDFYAGTGTPNLNTTVPNRMFRNVQGQIFEDVSFPTNTAHIQKGHGVSFGDVDADGDLDIYTVLGGAVEGDFYHNALFINKPAVPNHWLGVRLEGKSGNRPGIGSRLEIVYRENGQLRRAFRTVTTGGSFGASPFQQHFGLGKATVVDTLRIHWHGSGHVQELYGLAADSVYVVEEM